MVPYKILQLQFHKSLRKNSIALTSSFWGKSWRLLPPEAHRELKMQDINYLLRAPSIILW